MNYRELLEHSYNIENHNDMDGISRLEFLGDKIFNFFTYDGAISAMFAEKALEVCVAINDSKTFEYQEDKENYKWYVIMCNMQFFEHKLEWGTSIRGAWWLHGIEVEINLTDWMYDENYRQITNSVVIDRDQFIEFVVAMVNFCKCEIGE